MGVARAGLREILIATATAGAGGAVSAWAAVTVDPRYWALALPLILVWLAILAFFRDPHREMPEEEGVLVAPADGKVTEITRLAEYEGIGGPALRIGIFLSIFDVHINRAPCAGRVVKSDYRRGAFLDARDPESSVRNEANTLTIEPEAGLRGPIVVRQIAGWVARRVVCEVQPGDLLAGGQRIGLIKFGSRTELIVPADSGLEPAVRVGDHVAGGTTVLMRARRAAESAMPPEPATAATSSPVASGAGSKTP